MSPSSTTNSEPRRWDAGKADGLVALPPAATSGSQRRLLMAAVVTFFLGLTAGTGLVDGVWPVPPPALLGLEKKLEEQILVRARFADGSTARWVDRHLRLRSRVRHIVLPFYALTLYRWLGEVRGDLLLGRDGWLFIRDREVPRRRAWRALAAAPGVMAELERRLESRGTRLIWVPIPRKSVVSTRYLPPRIFVGARLETRLFRELEDRGVDHVDLLALFSRLESDGDGPTFFKTDSHWTFRSVIRAAEEISLHAGLWVPPERRATQIREAGDQLRFDLLRHQGVRLTALTAAYLDRTRTPVFEVVDRRGAVTKRRRSPPGAADVVVLGTSFSAMGLADYLAHFTQRRVGDWSGPGLSYIVQLERLLLEHPERPIPPILIVEFPTHQLFQHRLADRASNLVDRLTP